MSEERTQPAPHGGGAVDERLYTATNAERLYIEADAELIDRFAVALKDKLAIARARGKRGWSNPDWMDDCRRQLVEHIAKGDPRDVANYCAFLWHHGEPTNGSGADAARPHPAGGAGARVALAALMEKEPALMHQTAEYEWQRSYWVCRFCHGTSLEAEWNADRADAVVHMDKCFYVNVVAPALAAAPPPAPATEGEDVERLRAVAREGLRDHQRWDHALHVIADGVDKVPGPPCWCRICCVARGAVVPTPVVPHPLLRGEGGR